MAPLPVDLAPRIRVPLLGVEFRFANPGAGCWPGILRARGALLDEVVCHAGPYALRQGRDVLAYYDALTALFAAGMPTGHPGRLDDGTQEGREIGLATSIALELEDGPVSEGSQLEVFALPGLAGLRSTLARPGRPDGADAEAGLTRWVEATASGRAGRARPGLQRRFELDMGDLGGDGSRIPWRRMLFLAVLAHLRFDFELAAETGLLPLRRCQRRACGAFFRVKRMTGRPQRFCCSVCRASAAREQ